jgi:hypothetical protein
LGKFTLNRSFPFLRHAACSSKGFRGRGGRGGAGLCELEALDQKLFGDLPLTNGIFELVYQVVAGKFIELV